MSDSPIPGTILRPASVWADESLRLLRPTADERIYANFQTYEARSRAAAVYGVNVSRLAGIKYKYDRENFFRRNSNIPPTGNTPKEFKTA